MLKIILLNHIQQEKSCFAICSVPNYIYRIFFFNKPQLHGITLLNIYLFIFLLQFWLSWVFISVWRLSLVACESGLCSSGGAWASPGGAQSSGHASSVVAAHRLRDGLCVPSIFRQIQPLTTKKVSKHFLKHQIFIINRLQ